MGLQDVGNPSCALHLGVVERGIEFPHLVYQRLYKFTIFESPLIGR